MKILIKNGTILNADSEVNADLLIQDEKIVIIGKNLDCTADKTIDAKGKYIFPGGIDQHTHFEALTNVGDKDTSGYEFTKALIVGGTTTIIDYAPQDENCGLIESAKHRINKKAKGKTCVDFGLHALITEVNDEMFREIRELPKMGISSIKGFMAYIGSPLHVDDGTLYEVLKESKKAGVTTFVHAENGEIINKLQKDCIKLGNIEPKYHAISRPPFVEVEATKRALYYSEILDAPIFIVHVSTKGAADAIAESRLKNVRAYGETCTHYLTTTKKELDNPDFNEAAKYVCSPALRDQDDLDAMFDAINNGTLSAIVSDHCGIDLAEMKQVGKDNFVDIPNGAPGAADRINMIWSYGVAKKRITKQRFVEVCSTLPAKINGMYPKKGVIEVGSDADIVVFDPDYRGTIKLEDNPNGVDYNIYEGREQIGRPETVLLRGKIVLEDGKFVGELGQGKFIPCEPFAHCFEGRR